MHVSYSLAKSTRQEVIVIIHKIFFLLDSKLEMLQKKSPSLMKRVVDVLYYNLTFEDLVLFLNMVVLSLKERSQIWSTYDTIQQTGWAELQDKHLSCKKKANHNLDVCAVCKEPLSSKIGVNLKALSCLHACHVPCLEDYQKK